MSVVDFATDFNGDEDTGLVPVVEGGMANAKLLHYFLFGHEAFYGILAGGRYDFIKDTLDDAVGEGNEVLIFYGDVEVGDAAFNKGFEV